ncbi:MAG: YifB family Mg chelatase-like AAA ATPase [Halanaerobiales bacterium]|nr:YifB family Mg chelatase-like AAA ATPase [Halanaerobiales bacterium]
MLAKILSTSYIGVEGFPIVVEVDLSNGLPAFDLVGLPNTAVREARKRVRSALKNSPYPYPRERITINLAPADIPKEGSYFDLPIAIGILAAEGIVPSDKLCEFAFIGELSLDGKIKPIRGSLAMALTVKELGLHGLILPKENYSEAKAVHQIELVPVSSLEEVVNFLRTGDIHYPDIKKTLPQNSMEVDLASIKGQLFAKRGLEIAASGGHNLLLIGPPGSGKTLLARSIPGIIPPLSEEESLQVTRIHSIAGINHQAQHLLTQPPFRQPHHSITPAALIGGGRIPLPGEISLAHHGILFLDEMGEFRSDLLNLLRQPLEMSQVVVTRHQHRVIFPAQFILIGALNPCKCGFYGDPSGRCICSSSEIRRYFQKISGPLLDRIDLQIQVSRMNSDDLFNTNKVESSSTVRTRVFKAREIQSYRYCSTPFNLNSQIPLSQIKIFCPLATKAEKILAQAMDRLELTARGCHQIIKVARTIADLRQAKIIDTEDIAEAIQYRSFDRLHCGY